MESRSPGAKDDLPHHFIKLVGTELAFGLCQNYKVEFVFLRRHIPRGLEMYCGLSNNWSTSSGKRSQNCGSHSKALFRDI